MAIPLPVLQKPDLSALSAALSARRKAAEPVDPLAGMTPAEIEDYQAQLDLAMNPRSALGEIGAGFGRGVVHGIPEQVGQALRATGKEGDTLHGLGTVVGDIAKSTRNVGLPDPESHGTLTNWTAAAGQSIPASLAAMAPAIATAVATGGAAVPVALAGAAGLALPSAAQFQDTYERGKEKGLTDAEAFAAGTKTGASEFATEFLPTMVGARVLTGALRRGGAKSAEAAADALRQDPSLLKNIGKGIGASAASEVPMEMANAAIQNSVEANAGIIKGDAWDAATGAFGPSLMQSAIFGVFGGGVAQARQRNQQDVMKAADKILNDPSAPITSWSAATKAQADLISTVTGDNEAANLWRLDRLADINERGLTAAKQELGGEAAGRIVKSAEDAAGSVDFTPSEFQPDLDAIFGRGGFKLTPSGASLPSIDFETPTGEQPQRGQTKLDFGEGTPLRTYRQANVDAATERLAGITPAAPSPAPAQGTAAMLGLPTAPRSDVIALPEATGPSVSLTKTRRIGILKELAPSLPAPIRNELIGLESSQFADAIQQVWHDKGGESGPMYNQKLEEVYAQITGKDIREVAASIPLSGRPAFELTGDDALTRERLADEQTTAQRAQAQDQIAADKAGRTAVKQRMGDLVSGKPTPTSKETQARQAKARFDSAVTNFKAALDSFDAQVQGEQNETAAPVDQGTQSKSAQPKTGAVTPPATPAGNAEAGNAQPGKGNTPPAKLGKGLTKLISNRVVDAAKERGVKAEAYQRIVTQQQIRDGIIDEAGNRLVPEAQLRSHLYALTTKPAAPTTAWGAALSGITNTQAQVKEARGTKKNAKGGKKDVADRAVTYAAERLKSLENTVAEFVQKGRPDLSHGEAVKEAKKLMGGKGSTWVYDQDWADSPNMRKAMGKFHGDFLKAARVTQVESLGTGKDTTAQDADMIAQLEEESAARKRFGRKAADIIDDAGELEAFDPNDERGSISGRLSRTPAEQATADKIQAGLTGKDLVGALDFVRANAPSMFARTLARMLRLSVGRLQDAGMKFDLRIAGEATRMPASMAAGVSNGVMRPRYPTKTMEVWLGGADLPNTGMSYSTVLHEVIHAISAAAFDIGRYTKNADTPMGKFTMDLIDVHNVVVGHIKAREKAVGEAGLTEFERSVFNQQGTNAFKNAEETLTWALTDTTVQKYLETVPYAPKKSMWQRLVDILAGLLGIKPNQQSALAEILRLGVDVANMDAKAIVKGVDTHWSSRELESVSSGKVYDVAKSWWDKIVEQMSGLTELGHKARTHLYGIASAEHIKGWIEKTPQLKPIEQYVKDFYKSYDDKTYLIQAARQEFYGYLNKVEQQLAANSKTMADRKTLSYRLSALGGEMSRWGLDLDKRYADQKNIEITQAEFEKLRSWWKALPTDALRQAVRDGIKVNRKFYTLNTAALTFNALQMYNSSVVGLQPLIDSLRLVDYNENNNTPLSTGPHIDTKSKHFAEKLEAAFKAVRELPETEETRTVKADLSIMEQYYAKATKNPYLHLGRTGNYFVRFNADATKADKLEALAEKAGAVVTTVSDKANSVFIRFGTLQQAKAFRAAVAEGGLSDGKEPVTAGAINEAGVVNTLTGVPAFIRAYLRKIEKDFAGDKYGLTKEQLENIRMTMMQFAIESLPESAPQKALARRRGTAGYESDFVQSFSKRAEGMSTSISNAYTIPEFDEAMAGMREATDKLAETDPDAQARAQEVYHELAMRLSNSLNPIESPMVDKAKTLGYNYFLALSPAFMLVNSMQPYHLALPVMGSRHGFARTFSHMTKAAGISLSTLRDTYVNGWKNGKFVGVVDADLATDKLSPAHKDLVQFLMRRGQLDFTQAMELGRMATGESHGMAMFAKIASLGSHITELNNRLTTAIAAYDLATTHPDLTKRMTKEKAQEYAMQMVKDTQYTYADHNTARYLGRHGLFGKLTPLFFSFQQYSFQSMELLARLTRDAFSKANPNITKGQRDEARQALGALTLTTAAIAGGLGLPFANVIAAVADGILGDDDDPMDSRAAVRKWLSDVFGKDVGEIIARGVPRALGVDVSSRAGWQDILPGSRFLTDKRKMEDALKDGALSAYGPAVNAGVDVLVGASYLAEGRVLDAAIQGLPLALRNPAKAYKLSQGGFTTKTDSELPLDVNGFDVFSQGLGFTPAKKAEQSEANFAFKVRDAQLKDQQAKIARGIYRGVERGEELPEALERYREFAAKNPLYAGDPGAGLQQRAKNRAVGELSGTGIPAATRYLPELQRYQFANVR